MALTQLQLYNRALAAIGQRQLPSIDSPATRETQVVLDDIYQSSDNGALNYCLEMAQPSFARKTAKLATAAASAVHDLDSVHTLPADYVTLITRPDGRSSVYSDANLSEEVGRYMIDSGSLACDFDPVYIRYLSNDLSLNDYEPSFIEVVVYYLAKEVATRLDSAEQSRAEELFWSRVKLCRELAEQRDKPLAEKTTYTLDSTLLGIYNDALLILGLERIATVSDSSQRRSVLDTAMNADLVEEILEDTAWVFGKTSTKLEYNPGVEPDWGYRRAFDKPANMLRLDGIYHDEYFQSPVDRYQDEGDYFFADVEEVYLQYVSRSFLTTPSQWPVYFRKLVAAALARDAAPSLGGSNMDNAMLRYEERKKSAMANDAMSGPPRKIRSGSWVRAAVGDRRSSRGRP